jgi:hypothetical protein
LILAKSACVLAEVRRACILILARNACIMILARGACIVLMKKWQLTDKLFHFILIALP